jgi:Mg chelatase-related protein
MDICVEINARESIKMEKGESSISIREKIMQVVEIQRKRFAKSTILWNAQMDAQMILRYCQLLPEDEQFLQEIYVQKGMSVRSLQKVKKVARTIADFSNSEQILRPHLAQALSFRVMEEKYWGGESNASTRH